jgi:hypothetical protein
MSINKKVVESLKKVTLAVTPLIASDASESAGPAQNVEFIFGVGPQGLSPFEYELAGRQPGDTIRVTVPPGKTGEVFCHMQSLFCGMAPNQDSLCLEVSIVDVSDAQQRDVVRALAGAAACGSDCDCGCGGH